MDISKGTPKDVMVLTYALLLRVDYEVRLVLTWVRSEPPMLSTGHENRVMATPINPNV